MNQLHWTAWVNSTDVMEGERNRTQKRKFLSPVYIKYKSGQNCSVRGQDGSHVEGSTMLFPYDMSTFMSVYFAYKAVAKKG